MSQEQYLHSETSSAPRPDLYDKILGCDLKYNGMRCGRTLEESECILHLEGIRLNLHEWSMAVGLGPYTFIPLSPIHCSS